MALTEEQKLRHRERVKAWRKTEKGRACLERQWAKDRARAEANDPLYRDQRAAHRRRYKATEKGRKTHNRATVRWRRRKRARNLTRDKVTLLWTMASRSCPSWLPPDVRDDIIMDIIAAFMAGEFAMRDVPKRAKAIITANRKHNSKWGTLSLDAERWADSGQTLHDTISEGLWQ